MLSIKTISMYRYRIGIPLKKIGLLNADTIGKFNKMAANMQMNAKR